MNEENHKPTEVSDPQGEDEFDSSKILEMAKLFSTLMADDKDEDEVKDKDEPNINQDDQSNNKSNQNNIFQLLEMAKLFSTLMGNNNNNKQSQAQIINTAPKAYPSSSILFDDTIHTPQMKVIKAAIPYMQVTNQKVLGVFIKFLELRKVIELYKDSNSPLSATSFSTNPNWQTEMLYSIRPHCSEEKQCIVDMMAKIMDIGELAKKMHSIKSTQIQKNQLDTDNSNKNQALLQALSPMLNENQRQMLNMLTTLMGTI